MKQEREVVPNILQAFFSMTYPINLHRIIKVKSHFDYHSTIWFNKEKHKFEDTEWQLSSVIYFINKWYEYLDKDWDRQINVLFSIVIFNTKRKTRFNRKETQTSARRGRKWRPWTTKLRSNVYFFEIIIRHQALTPAKNNRLFLFRALLKLYVANQRPFLPCCRSHVFSLAPLIVFRRGDCLQGFKHSTHCIVSWIVSFPPSQKGRLPAELCFSPPVERDRATNLRGDHRYDKNQASLHYWISMWWSHLPGGFIT